MAVVATPDLIPTETLAALQRDLGLADDDLAPALAITPRTLARWRRGLSTPNQAARARLALLLDLRDRLREDFDDPAVVRDWLRQPLPALAGGAPVECLRAGQVDRVVGLVDAFEWGLFSQMPPHAWRARAAVAAEPLAPWSSRAWRMHKRVYAALDDGGSRRRSGRYHRASDRFPPPHRTWPALYLALAPETALGETMRYMSARTLASAGSLRLSEIQVDLAAVLDCRDPTRLGLTLAELCDDLDYRLPQRLAAVARARGAEGLLVPSATRLGHNLVVFTDQLRPGSTVQVVDRRDPHLYVPRP